MSSTESSAKSTKPKRELDWYDNIENIRPKRNGHSASAVMAAANAKPVTTAEAREKFTDVLKEAESSEDPLEVLVQFVKWFDDNFLSGKVSVLQPMLYQILTNYGTDPRYRNDERIMKLWLRLADNFPERGFAVMQLAFSRGSCKQLAKFYIFWAKMYEYAEQMDRAREILARGIHCKAIPVVDLHEASDQLELRICKWTMEKQKKQDELDLSDDDLSHVEREYTRKMLNRFEVEETERGYRAPVDRSDTSTPKKLHINPINKPSFEVYVDEEEEEEEEDERPPRNLNKNAATLEEQLRVDPDWQSIYGYKENQGFHLDITQNVVRPDTMGAPRLQGFRPLPGEPLAAFSVYCENQTSKLKFAIRRELIRDQSIEEAFYQKWLQDTKVEE